MLSFSKFRAIVLTVVVTGVGVWGFSSWVLNSQIIEQSIKKAVEAGVSQATGLSVHVTTLQLNPTLFQGLQLQLNDIKLESPNRHKKLGHIQKIRLGLRYQPLIFNQVPEIGSVKISHLHLPMGTDNILSYLTLHTVPHNPNNWLKDPVLHNAVIQLWHTKIDAIGLAENKQLSPWTNERFRFHSKRIVIKNLFSSKKIIVDGTGTLKSSQTLNKTPLSLKGKVSLFPSVLSSQPEKLLQHLESLTFSATGNQALPITLTFNQSLKHQGKLLVKSPGLSLKTLQQVYSAVRQSLIVQAGKTEKKSSKQNALPVIPGKLDGLITLNHLVDIDTFTAIPSITNWSGVSQLQNVSFRQSPSNAKQPGLKMTALNGQVVFENNTIQLKPSRFLAEGFPVSMTGRYQVNTMAGKLLLTSLSVSVPKLLEKARAFSIPLNIEPDSSEGTVLLKAEISQKPKELPVLKSFITFKELAVSISETHLNHLNGTAEFHGQMLDGHYIRFQANGKLLEGQFSGNQYQLKVNRVAGHVKADGLMDTAGHMVEPLNYQGELSLKEGQFQAYPVSKQSGKIPPVQQFEGLFTFSPNLIGIKPFKTKLAEGTLSASGNIVPNIAHWEQSAYDLHIQSTPLQLNALQKILLANSQAPLPVDMPSVSGTSQFDIHLKTGQKAFGQLSLQNLVVKSKESPFPIELPLATVNFNGSSVQLPKTSLSVGPLTATISGESSGLQRYQLSVESGRIPVSLIRDESPLIRQMSGIQLPEIWNTAGALSIKGNVTNAETTMQLDFDKAGLSWRNGNLPVYNMSGKILFHQLAGQTPSVRSKDFHFYYGNSLFTLSLEKKESFQALIKGVLSPLTVNHFMVSHQSNAKPYNAIPFIARFSGMLGGVSPQDDNIEASIDLDLDNTFKNASNRPWSKRATRAKKETTSTSLSDDGVQADNALTHPLNKSSYIQNISVPSFFESVSDLSAHAYLRAKAHWQNGSLLIEDALLNLFDSGRVSLLGSIDNLLDEQRRIYVFQAKTLPDINLERLAHHVPENRFLKTVSGTVTINSQLAFDTMGDKLASGSITLDNIAIPDITLRALNGTVSFQDETGSFEFDQMEIPGISANLSGRTDNVFHIPMTLSDVKLGGKFLSLDSLTAFNTTIVHPILVDELAHSFLRPWQQGDPTSPFEFKNADLHFDEAIYQNIILSHLNSHFSLYSNSFFEMADTEAETAGGKISGQLSMSPNDNSFTNLELNANHVKVNVLTKALLGVSNQIYGDMDGSIRFTTFGQSDIEMQKNANGTVSIDITNGRLPAIAKVETLLTTANIFRGGILGFNLNNLFRTLRFYDSNYFAELKGDMQINDQVLYTSNLLSDGQNLDLLIQGKVKMDDGIADMKVNGTMQQNVKGKLGFLGRLSLGKAIGVIPVLGNLGENRSGLLNYVPGVGYFPGFGGPAKEFSRFQVYIKGLPGSPTSIKGFKWIK